ncbi:efflux RND transporter periplasmic adaptor subunit [Piscinibacter terrae]|uniref:HlyD family efflux transporter periplasmic adaptor subunit n=1 Tax=Piscinibacter terrae TaxID=2496871 RepID=A0A3N7HRF4_9BURK|nr:HlyD family efflux transporter periplasmic adaptor subunit [Albitalea terrae]RQP23786.1 HlyD family efflux transporter periplasmic adaptor subunit [Albitalea terrae]
MKTNANTWLMRRVASTVATGLVCALAAACTPGPEASQAPAPAAATVEAVAQAKGRVDVEGGVQRIVAPREGVIDKVLVDIGDEVAAGQVVAHLATKKAELAVALAQAELDQALARVSAQRARLPALKERSQRMRDAAAAGAQSGQMSDDAAAAVHELEADIAALEAAAQVARRQRDLAQEAVLSSAVRAQAAGRIVERFAHVGDGVNAAAPLFSIKPPRPLVVLADLNEELVDRVKPGTRAEIILSGADAASHTAQVIRIGEVFGPARLGDESQPAVDARSVECVLRLDDQALRIGQRVRVRFLR